jgi:ubiquitin-protein ligase
MSEWHAAILGPEGTPYWGGVFLFDLSFGPQYPHTPPKVRHALSVASQSPVSHGVYTGGV